MKLSTQMFILLLCMVALLATFQYVLLRLEKGRVKNYAASFGAVADVKAEAGGLGFLDGVFKSKAKARPEAYSYANLYCNKNICSFSMRKKSSFMPSLTVTADKETLVKECLSPGTNVPGDICRDFKKVGWDIIRAEGQ
jgi:hypothetical protein